MNISSTLEDRSESKCELCNSTDQLSTLIVAPKSGDSDSDLVVVCHNCHEQIDKDELNPDHWRCLSESVWSQVPAVQVMSFRILKKLQLPWAQELISSMYMDEATQEWAEQGSQDSTIVHKDSNGNILNAGDSVVLIKDLNVKGSSLVAKRGTAVRRIRLDPDNAEYIEGKVDGQQIVIITKFVKKMG